MGQPSIAFKGLFEDSHRIHGKGLIREFSVNRKLRGSLSRYCSTDIAVTDEADRD
jgi:hypothetical protein